MRRAFIAVGVIIALLVLGLVVFAATFNVNRYRPKIQSELEARLARNVSLGEMHLGVFPPRFRVQDLAVADDPDFNAKTPFIQAKQLDVSVKLFPLLRRDVEIDSLNLQRPSVELIKNQQGMWNFSSLGGSPKATETSAPTEGPAKTGGTAGGQFSLSKLTISDGQVALTDLEKKRPRAVYDHIDATVRDFASNRPFSVDIAAHLPGPGTQEVRLQGNGGPIAPREPVNTPFHGTLVLKQVGIAGLRAFLDSPALANTDGVVSGQTKISSESGKLAASGDMSVQNGLVHGVNLGYPVTATYDVADDLANDVVTVRNTTVKLGATPILLAGTLNTKPTPAQVDLHVKADNISVAEIARLSAASGLVFAADSTVSGNLNADIQARGAADKPTLNGTVSGRNLQISGKSVPQPVQIKAINLALTPAEIHSDKFNLNSGGTTVAAQFTLREYASSPPLMDATVQAPNAAFREVLSIAKAYGVTGLEKINGEGTLGMDMRIAGRVQSLSSADMMKALNGALNLNLNSVRYAGTDIGHQLTSLGGLVKSDEKDQGFTNISRLTGNIAVKNGVAESHDIQAQLDVGNLGAAGTANLVDQQLNMRVAIVLSKAFSSRVSGGAAGAGGYLNTALANNQGELVIPAIVTGTFQNPRFAPDLQKLAQMKLKGLAPSFNDPVSGVSGVLGSLLGPKGANQPAQDTKAQQQPQAQPNPVQQIRDLFRKNKKQ